MLLHARLHVERNVHTLFKSLHISDTEIATVTKIRSLDRARRHVSGELYRAQNWSMD
jgi:hypothetical protein